MAITINTIPVLKDAEAESFLKTAERNSKDKKSIDFKKQFNVASKILTKAKLT